MMPFAAIMKSYRSILFTIVAGYLLTILGLTYLWARIDSDLSTLETQTTKLYQHPFQVNAAAHEARLAVSQIRISLLYALTVHSDDHHSDLAHVIARYDSKLDHSLNIIETHFLGDIATIRETRKLIEEWKKGRAELIDLLTKGRYSEAQPFMLAQTGPIYEQIIRQLDYVIDFSSEKANLLAEEARNKSNSSHSLFLRLLIAFLLLTLAIAIMTILAVVSKLRQRDELLAQNQERIRLMAENITGFSTFLLDSEGRIASWNDGAKQMKGYEADEIIGQNIDRFYTPEEVISGKPARVLVLAKLKNHHEDQGWRIRKDGSRFYAEVIISLCHGPEGKQLGFINLTHDITDRKLSEDALREKELQYRMAIETSIDGFWVVNMEGRLIEVNDAYVMLSGYSRAELLSMRITDLEAKELPKETAAHIDKIRREGGDRFETSHRTKGGRVWPVEIIVSHSPMLGGRQFVFIKDLTEKKKYEQLIRQQANYDALTELPNRRMVYDRLEHEIKKSHRMEVPLAVFFIDLDRFKEVNDTLGHDVGDILLKEAAQRMIDCVRETDTVGRLGGDEFTIIVGELDDIRNVERIASNILQKLTAPFRLGSEVAYISASIGITIYPDDAMDVATLLKNADQAMYAAKREGRNRFHYYKPTMQVAANIRMQLANDLHTALSNNQFRVHYQPIVELATGAIHKAEALIRWEHPSLGMISPADFIPIAEETGLIVDIGHWVFRQAAAQSARARATHHPDFQISVNMSPIQFKSDPDKQNQWFDYLQELGLPGRSIVVEITEGLLMEARTNISSQLLAFRDHGLKVALDDFGTGYSSLAYLKKFDIDYLKIDQSFVKNIAHDFSDTALCEAMIEMAHKLGIKVIAEGVETPEQLKLLEEIGCDFGQGYLFSRPTPAEEFMKLLDTRL